MDDQPDALVSDAPSARPWAFDEPRFVLRTSGTTGRSRPVTLSTAQVLFSAFGSAMRLGHLPQDCWLAVLPLHHVGGLSVLMRSLFAASAVELNASAPVVQQGSKPRTSNCDGDAFGVATRTARQIEKASPFYLVVACGERGGLK